MVSSLMAQSTAVYEESYRRFEDGLQLLEKNLYPAAQICFLDYLEKGEDEEKKIEAEYFVALCALRSQAPDADTRLEAFLSRYPSHPKALDAYFQWAEVYYERQEYDRAIDFFEKVPERRLSLARQADRNFKLGLAYFQRKKFNQALMYFDKLKESSSTYAAPASYYAGYIAYKEQRFDIARKDLENATASEAFALLTPILIADIYNQTGKTRELIAFTEPVLKKNQNLAQLAEVHLLTGDAYFALEDFGKALYHYRQYLGLTNQAPAPATSYRLGFSQYQTSDFKGATESLQNIATSNDKLGQAAAYYLGLAYLRDGNKRFAVTALEQAQGRRFEPLIEQEATWLLGKLNYELERYDEAIVQLKKMVENYPQHPDRGEALDLLSKAYLYSKKLDEALAYLESIPQKSPSVLAAYQQITFARGSEYFNQGNFASAAGLFEKSLQNPTIRDLALETNYWLAESHLLGENPKAAIPYYQQILSLDQPNYPYTAKSHYGLAYAYYNTEEYARAIPHLQYYITFRNPQDDRRFLEDAFIRLADCYYAEKDYPNAQRFYDQVIALKYADQDYAYFQRGVVANLQNQPTVAQASFEALIAQFPNSLYRDRAFYQKALVDLDNASYAPAISSLSQLMNEKPNSPLVPDALLVRGLAYTNIGNQNAAIEDYKKIVNDYTTHPNASDALLSLQELLSAQGREAELNPLVAKFREANPNSQTAERIYFENAKTAYFNQQYEPAVRLFQQYLSNYPNSVYKGEGLYFLGESYFRLNDFNNALTYHRQVTQDAGNVYLARAARRVAGIYFQSQDYRPAASYYRLLASVTQSKREQSEAWLGLIESYYELQRDDSLNYFANQVLAQGESVAIKNRATLYLGKLAYRKQNYASALATFQKLANASNDQNGAEAQYLWADILFKQAKHRESLEVLFELDKKFSAFEKWRSRAFLLIADNYIALGENFQARATLQSVIDKSPDAEAVQEARQKLQRLPQ
ncbi:MAG: tetratricopeptide repeat protein [Microscillaceae bacterium]